MCFLSFAVERFLRVLDEYLERVVHPNYLFLFYLSLFGLGVGLCSLQVSGLGTVLVRTSCAAEASREGTADTVVCSFLESSGLLYPLCGFAYQLTPSGPSLLVLECVLVLCLLAMWAVSRCRRCVSCAFSVL